MFKPIPRAIGCPLAAIVLATFMHVLHAAQNDLPSKPRVTPEKLKGALASLEKLTQQTMQKTGVPGIAIAVVHNDEVVYLKGFGVREAGKPETIDADTVFQIASISKPITSTVLAALVSQQKINWDDHVCDLDPDFEMHDAWVTRQLTLRDLLCHRSGLPDHAGDLLEDIGFDQAAVLYRLRFMKPASSFRSQFAYTNFGFTEAALAAARSVGKPWADVAAEQLLQPLGMSSTSCRYDDYSAAKNRALLHVKIDGKWTAKYNRNADPQAPAGGVSSTARDMAQWLRLQLEEGKYIGKQLISAEALAETHRPQIVSHQAGNAATDRAGFYGLAWNINYDEHGLVRLNHSGGFDLGAATVVNLVPAERLGVVILSNSSPIGVPEALAMTFTDDALYGQPQRDWFELYRKGFEDLAKPNYGTAVDYHKPPEKPSPAMPNATYVGKFESKLCGDMEIVERQGDLAMKLGPKMQPYALTHWDRDVFLYQPVGEMSSGLSAVTFTVGPDQKATQVTVENLDVDGQGIFKRSAAAGN